MEQDVKLTIQDLYPHLAENELRKAEDNLEQYLALVLRIFERLESESHPQADQLTANSSTLSCTPPASGASA